MPHWADHQSTQHHPLQDAGHRERASEVRSTGIAILVALAVGVGIATVGHGVRLWVWGDEPAATSNEAREAPEATATNEERSPLEAPFQPFLSAP